jgi:hypothetical protein
MNVPECTRNLICSKGMCTKEGIPTREGLILMIEMTYLRQAQAV